MELFIEVLGWVAAAVLLGAYGLLTRGRLSSHGSSYQTLNMVGSLCMAANAFANEAWPSLSVNALWLVIGVASLAASRRRARGRHEDRAHVGASSPGSDDPDRITLRAHREQSVHARAAVAPAHHSDARPPRTARGVDARAEVPTAP
jgi:hypothetical protein